MSSTPHLDTADSIAVIGLAGRFPGAPTIDLFWENLKHGKEAIQFFTNEELARCEFDFASLKHNPDYVKAGAVLQDVEFFDASFFGFTPREAALLDPQHRIFLECAWEALEYAGYNPENYQGAIGVFGGCRMNTYLLNNLCTDRNFIEGFIRDRSVDTLQHFISNDKDFLPTRVSYKLNLKGPSVNVQTGCSTSLVAVCLACQSLLTYESDMALAGGVAVKFPQQRGYIYREGRMESPDGHCRPFDAQAQGTVFGNGAGVVVLKRLEDALTDGDTLYAVIKGTALNNDGSVKVSYTAPSVDGQATVIAMAQAVAGVDPETITYIEAHGTGTRLGDPIEIAGLTKAFRAKTQAVKFCGIGSVKSNIGHLDTASGISGFIKTILALRYKIIPPSINFYSPNPEIDFSNSPFYVVTEPKPWETNNVPRRAGVSSFGVGGTNAHVVLEEAPSVEPDDASRPSQLITLSARTKTALETATQNLGRHIQLHPELSLRDVAYTLNVGRKDFEYRRMLVCTDQKDLLNVLEPLHQERVITRQAMSATPSPVFILPGMGGYAHMSQGIYDHEPVFQEYIDECSAVVASLTGIDPRAALYQDSAARNDSLKNNKDSFENMLGLFAVEYATAKLFMAWGVSPSAFVGCGIGALVAGCLANVFDIDDAVRLLHNEVSLRTGAAGQKRQVHGEIDTIKCMSPTVPILCSDTGVPIQDTQAKDSAYWQQQLCAPDSFTGAITNLRNDSRQVFVVMGPAHILLLQMDDAQDFVFTLHNTRSSQDELMTVLKALGQLWLAGVKIDWHCFYKHEHRLRVPLPTYPFERIRCWVEPPSRNTENLLQEALRQNGILTNPLLFVEDFMQQKISSGIPAAGAGAQADAASVGNRKDNILLEITRILHELSGIDLAATDPSTSFFDLGFDSLFLTQISLEFQKKFGVKITLRLLIEDVPSPSLLAEYLDKQLPPEAFAPAPERGATQRHFPIAEDLQTSLLQSFESSPSQSLVEQVIARQFTIMQQQLDLLRSAGSSLTLPSSVPALNLKKDMAAPVAAKPQGQQPVISRGEQEFKRHGPYKPFEKDQDKKPDGLTSRQRKALDDLLARYQRKTPGSKKMTQAHRSRFADPRAVAGFKTLWKEITYPVIARRAFGAKLWDVDGNEWLDVTMGFGVHLFGLSPPFVTEAVEAQLKRGIAIGPQSDIAGEIAEMICDFTGMERVTFCNTGSEAVLGSLRAARTVTGRNRVVLFAGDYHGINDEVLVRSHMLKGRRMSSPIAPGIPSEMVHNMTVLDYGQPESLGFIESEAQNLAAVIVEPVQARRPELQPKEFLHALRALTLKTGSALIFDEVVTGFRIHPGGAQAWFDVRADLATYGKVIGGGMPIGVIAGTAAYMDAFDGGMWQYGDNSIPEAGVTFFAGTFVRHPLAMAAAQAVLSYLKKESPRLQQDLNERTTRFAGEVNSCFEKAGLSLRLTHFASMCYFSHAEEMKYFSLLFHVLRDRGVHIWEGRPFFFSTAHTDEDIKFLINAFRESINEMREGGFLEEPSGWPAREPQSPSDETGTAKKIASFPLSEAQMEIWLAAQISDEASCAFNESSTFTFQGPLNVEALRRALWRMVERHEALRTVFEKDGGIQRVLPTMHIELPVLDLSHQEPDKRNNEVTQIIDRDVRWPFDLVNGPLLRAHLLKIEDEKHLLVLTAHHIVCDGWSYDVMVHDLSMVYTMECRGQSDQRPNPMQIGDYVLWQEQEKQRPEYASAEKYWLEQLSGTLPVLELPVDRSRPSLKTYGGARETVVFSQSLYADIKKTGSSHKCTLFSTLLAAYAVLLYRLTGHDDIIIGIPAAGQSIVENHDLVGHCTNLLPLRFRIDPAQPFLSFLKAVQRMVLDAYETQMITFGTLVKRLNVPRDPGRTPLVSAIFNVDPAVHGLDFTGLQVKIVANPRSGFQFECGFNMVASDTDLVLECDYNTGLFYPATMRQWMGYYQTILKSVVRDFQQPLSSIALLSEAERTTVLVAWNDTERLYPQDRCLHELFEAQAALTPDSIAVVHENGSLTYGMLNAKANQLAHYLRSLGIAPEKPVALYMTRSTNMIIAILGILKAGGFYIPIDPAYPKERLRFILNDAQTSCVVSEQELCADLSEYGATIISVNAAQETLCRQSTANPPALAKPDNLAYVIYTSGSTGIPKGVAIEHHSPVTLLHWAREVYTAAEYAGVLFATSVCFDLSIFELFVPLSWGGKVILAGHVLTLPDLAERHEVTLLNTVPSAATELLRLGDLPASIQTVNLAGEPLSQELVQKLYRQPSVKKVYDLYGPSEDTTYSTFALRRQDGPATIGRPIANTKVYILDANRTPVPIGVAGEIYLGGDGLARGYLNRPELTGEKFIPNPFPSGAATRLYRTGDLGRYLPDGNIIFLGRMDYQVKIRGYRIELGEIEAAIEEMPGIRESVVLAREDMAGDKQLVGYVVPDLRNDSAEFFPEGGMATAQVGSWKTKWDMLYASALDVITSGDARTQKDLTVLKDYGLEQWVSGSAAADDAAIKQFQEQTVRRILDLRPRRVMEIGCGAGQLLFRIAPECEYYFATDFVALAIDKLREKIFAAGKGFSHVAMEQRAADNCEGIADGAFDTVIINSVIQYFPDVQYLLRVIRNVLRIVKPGGCIYIGDVKSFSLLEAFHADNELARSADTVPAAELRNCIMTRVLHEEELYVDPVFFRGLRNEMPSISHVALRHRQGRLINMTTQFHYDVLIYAGEHAVRTVRPSWIDWSSAGLSLAGIHEQLENKSPDVYCIKNIPNARTYRAVQAVKILNGAILPATAGDIKKSLDTLPAGVDPEDLWAMRAHLPYSVDIQWTDSAGEGFMDAVFIRSTSDVPGIPWVESIDDEKHAAAPPGSSANSPLMNTVGAKLIPLLREHLRVKLPRHMLPTAFAVLEALPRTPNGKIDRRALPPPDKSLSTVDKSFVVPATETERTVASIWCGVLGVKFIGTHDNFFELGGHSLMAVQITSLLREAFQIDLPLSGLFEMPTVQSLSQAIDALRYLKERSAGQGASKNADREEITI